MTTQRIHAIENRIRRIQKDLALIGEMRPGTLSQQYRKSASGTFAYWQLSYTHRMKSRTDYVRPECVAQTRRQVEMYKKFKKLVDEWVDLAIEYTKLKSKQGANQ
jgi:hypothetical protein